MKSILIAFAAVALISTAAQAQYGYGSNTRSHTVSPYVNSHGTYVQGSQATNPNNTQMDNYSTRGNVNPYTGAVGTRAPRY
ncbi:hypothetical protein [Rhodopseudomonas sp. BR0M22]|uniref:hypothetical protein n=1 Tax=Rhodopseudomonas sp. BR0M22 TaxID=2269369 RepID=UPI0013DF2A3F|nr:hypothetical protein [Rhodopseudomonas sp. BR0M22]NEW93033.1 hypothetical protein [Rhodopseudomonas sp. BR0M22]